MRHSPGKPHILTYVCEDCVSEHMREAGLHSEGTCPVCGSLMRIEDLFDDRRIVAVPVDFERREPAA